MKLLALPLAEVHSPDAVFRCTPYGVILEARCCLVRHAKARKGIGGDSYRLCVACGEGIAVELQTGGPVDLDAYAGKQEAARRRGGAKKTSLGHGRHKRHV